MEKSATLSAGCLQSKKKVQQTVHFIVHDYSRLGDQDMAAKEQVDSGDHGDGKARMVSCGNVRSPRAGDCC